MPSTPSSAVHIDWCHLDQVPEVQKFIDTYWAAGHVLARDRDLLMWQHRFAHRRDLLAILMAEKGGELVGIQGLIPYTFMDRGTRRSACWLTTWQVRPGRDVRGVGLRLLGTALRSGFEIAGTVGANAYVMPAYRALRFATWDGIPRYVRVIDEERCRALLGSPAKGIEAWLATARREAPEGSPDTKVVPWHEDLADPWERAFTADIAPRFVGGTRDTAHLRWRYLEHPRFRYVLRLSVTQGKVDGLSVHRVEHIRDRDERLVRVVEMLGSPQATKALVADLVRTATELGAAMIDYYQVGQAGSAALQAAGFVREHRLPGGMPSLFQPYEPEPRPLRAALWAQPATTDDVEAFFGRPELYLTRSDCDQDRPN